MKATVEVKVAPPLRGLVREASTIAAEGDTVGELLQYLDGQFPGLKSRMTNERGELYASYIFLLNDEDIRSRKGLETPLEDGDVVSIMVVLSGG